jgi:hypothetical protein
VQSLGILFSTETVLGHYSARPLNVLARAEAQRSGPIVQIGATADDTSRVGFNSTP